MKRIVLIVTAIIILFSLVSDMFAKDDFLWEIKGGKNKMYLMGSIHMMPENAYPLDEDVVKCFNKSDILAVEANPNNTDPAKIQQFVMSKGMYSDGKSLKTEIDSVLYNDVAKAFNGFGIPMAQVNMMKPWFVGLNLAGLSFKKLDMTPGLGLDVHFINQATEKGMDIIELESISAQMEILTSFPEDDQEEYLKYSIDNIEDTEEMIKTMYKAWQTGDDKLMNKTTKLKMKEAIKDLPSMEAFYNKLFYDRDIKMKDKLVKYLESEEEHTYFIVVGSGHLIGENGLLDLLKKAGYKTKQI